jgi:hypothetical protein
MMPQTGDRCSLYDKIDGLDEARTVADLVARLKPILNELAYYGITGEAAVMDDREAWHTTFTDRLYEATGVDRQAALSKAGLPPTSTLTSYSAPVVANKQQHPPRGRGSNAGTAKPFGEEKKRLPLGPPNRPRAGDLSPSLAAILDGSHPSFRDNEGYEGFHHQG